MSPHLLLLSLVFPLISCEVAFRINEKLSTDPEFYEQWRDLVAIQDRQMTDHPEDLYQFSTVLDQLRTCPLIRTLSDGVHNLRVNDVAIYADIGHLSTFCRHNLTRLNNGDLDSCGHHSSSSELPTLDKMIKVFNPNLTVMNVHRNHDESFVNQVKEITARIKAIPDHEEKWKMIFMLPNIQDGEASETGQAAIEVLQAIEYLNDNLPRKTFIVVLKSSGKGMWRDASHAHSACLTLLDRWKKYVDHNSESVWEQVNTIVEKNFQHQLFTVEILPLLNEGALAQFPNGSDLSSLGYDCAHWSERGLSLLHVAIWTAMLSSQSMRTREYRPVHSMPKCPEPRCPFIRTSSNSAVCLWSKIEDDPFPLAPQIIAVAILAVCALLCFILVLFLCLRKDKSTLKKEKAFGSNFSSIKFIDDDV
ncbi:hypothetical protein PFISCL1PPCAC_2534 [Pristionchus fissidentatus]|uniref:Uncharacterized protein n=1 Tax=Pristionchus fissidentatus TaxID=1538716 RepID=A0AAV5UXC8_9BILA|nr:hypothetical protein PFISCL1PPCAC_2534 [Pristionchus fissidentatus]